MYSMRINVMKSFIYYSCLAIVLIPVFSTRADEPLTVLFYGNSFTLGSGSTEAQAIGGVPGVVGQLAVAAGHAAPNIENAAASGQTLTWHLSNNLAVISNPLDFTEAPGFQWDYVVLQGYSTKPTHIGDLNQFRTDLLALYSQVHTHSPGVEAVLYETWARQPGHSVYTGTTPSFPGGPAQMQEELRTGYDQAELDVDLAFETDCAIVAPVGDAWEATGWDNLHATDLYHANTRGTYLAALVIYGTIYEESVVGLPKVFAGLTTQEAAELQEYAELVIPRPCGFVGADCNANCVPDTREPDCNSNLIPDECDILGGSSADCDDDGIPNECERVQTVVWFDDFDSDTQSEWTVLAGGAGDSAVFHFDYGERSIPSAPNSLNGTTRGVKLEVNTAAGSAASSGICIFPAAQTFEGDYTLQWDMYLSWEAPESTEHACAGINHSGTRLAASGEIANDTDGVFFAVAGDGGVSRGSYPLDGAIKDYNAYYGVNGAQPVRQVVPHWDNGQLFPGEVFPITVGDPIGDSLAGTPGRQWVEGEIKQEAGVVTWRLNGETIYQRENDSGFDSGKIMLGYFDHFPGQNTTGNTFIIFDNVRVSVPVDDRGVLAACMTGPCLSGSCTFLFYDAACCIVDYDADGDVDLLDFAQFQMSYTPPPPALHFAPDSLSYTLEQGDIERKIAMVTAEDAGVPTVDLIAVDDETQASPAWLSFPVSVAAGTPVAMDVDATGLLPGTYTATVTASASGYTPCTLAVSLVVEVSATDQTMLVDFGGAGTLTSGETRYWNNVHTDNMDGVMILRTVSGSMTGMILDISTGYGFNGANPNGTTSPIAQSDLANLQYPVTAIQDSLFGNDVAFNGGGFRYGGDRSV